MKCPFAVDIALVMVALCCSAEVTNGTNATDLNSFAATGVGEWTLSGANNHDWYQVRVSDSGQYMYAIADHSIFMSSDYGGNWSVSSAPSLSYATLTTNSSGQLVYAVQNSGSQLVPSLYFSNDFGETWTPQSSLEGQNGATRISCSSSGQVVIIVGYYYAGTADDNIWYSTDFGESWGSTVIDGRLYDLAMDETGMYAATVAGDGGGLYVCSDYGQTWTRLSFHGTNLFDVKMSSNGQNILVVDSVVRGGIYLSTNFGEDMVQLSNPPNCTVSHTAASGDLQFIMTMYYGDPESSYFSSDGGATWNLTEYSLNTDPNEDDSFFTMASSKTGQLMAGGVYGGGMHLYQPACPEGYEHTGWDPVTDPSGSNLCFTCGEGSYGQYTADGGDVECISCSVGSYSTSSQAAFGEDTCADCEYPYTTMEDDSHAESACHVFQVNLPQVFQWVIYSAGLVWLVIVVWFATRPGRMREGGTGTFLAVIAVLVLPFFNVCTDFAYLLISPFYHVSLFAACLVSVLHSVVLFLLHLYQLGALPTSLRFVWWLGYDTSARGKDPEDSEQTEGTPQGDFIPYPTITYPLDYSTFQTSRFVLLMAFDMHDNVVTICFEIFVWCIAVMMQVATIFVVPLCLLVWLVVGIILQMTLTISLTPLWNGWLLLWSGTDKFADMGRGGVDTADLSVGMFAHFLLEALPTLALQAVNNTLMDSWTEGSLEIMSVMLSAMVCLVCANALYKYLYQSLTHGEPLEMGRMLLAVDWTLLGIPLSPYTRKAKGAVAGVSDSKDGPELEESLLESGEGDESNSGEPPNCESPLHNCEYYVRPEPRFDEAPASVDVATVSSTDASGGSGWSYHGSDVADRLLRLYAPKERNEEGEDGADRDSGQEAGEDPFSRMLTGAGVPPDLQCHPSLTHLDSAVVIELFCENQSLTVFAEELSKFEVPRIISSKLFILLKSNVKSL